MKIYPYFFCFCFFISLSAIHAQDQVALFDYWKYYSDVENSLYKHHCHTIFDQLEKRKNQIQRLKTRDDWEKRKAMVRKKLSEIVGDFPDKTPLNPRITGKIQREDYRIEKVIYESMPGYYVTGALYIPEEYGSSGNKAPAIFYACGHSLDGFRSRIYQHIIINLVKKGFVVFTIDPMGQGERYEYWDTGLGRSRYPIPDHEHSYAGAQCLISGYSTARYFIWDVIRGIDYLLSREEVDPERIGMTGRSGGGNMTAYLGALDDRLLATAPECYITNYEYLCKSIGPQCAEQNLYQMTFHGLDHPDFIIARAPKPTLIISTTRDFFSIQGARESFIEARRMYDFLESGENLRMIEDDTIHSSTPKNREAMYAFFQKYLDNPGNPVDLMVEIPDPGVLQVTRTGQVVTTFQGRSIFSMNRDIAEKQITELERSREEDPQDLLDGLPAVVSRQTGFIYSDHYENPVFSGRFVHSEYRLEKFLIKGSGEYMLPVVIIRPTDSLSGKIIQYLDPGGVDHAVSQDSLVSWLVQKGHIIVLMDLPGIGSMGPGFLKGDSYIEEISYNQWFAAVLGGKSHVGLHMEDLMRSSQFIKDHFPDSCDRTAIAIGPLGIDLLHASVVNTEIKKICLIQPLISFANIATTRFYNPDYVPFMVAGAIEQYDLPDLMAAFHPRELLCINPKLADGSNASDSDIKNSWAFPYQIYEREASRSHINAISNLDFKGIQNELIRWLEE